MLVGPLTRIDVVHHGTRRGPSTFGFASNAVPGHYSGGLELDGHGPSPVSVSGGRTAVDVQCLPRDERGLLEIQNLDDIGDLTHAPQGMKTPNSASR